ncbi:MAG: hypothetical protein ACHBN1_16605 [Heteroscytonema crispum UTEX LB 1556]
MGRWGDKGRWVWETSKTSQTGVGVGCEARMRNAPNLFTKRPFLRVERSVTI